MWPNHDLLNIQVSAACASSFQIAHKLVRPGTNVHYSYFAPVTNVKRPLDLFPLLDEDFVPNLVLDSARGQQIIRQL